MYTAHKLRNRANLQIVRDIVDVQVPAHFRQDILNNLFAKIAVFVGDMKDDYLNIEPWFVFNAWLDCQIDPTSARYHLFRSWQVFHWHPHPTLVVQPVFNEEHPTIATAFLHKNRDHLSDSEIFILESASSQKIDMYEVVGIQPNHLILYGCVSQTKVVVCDPGLASIARIGEFLFANVLVNDTFQSIFLGRSEVLPRESQSMIDEFCDFAKRCEIDVPRSFKSFESDIFNLFYDIRSEMTSSR